MTVDETESPADQSVGLLSAQAGELYVNLVRADGALLGEGPGKVAPSDPAFRELSAAGLVRESSGRRVQPVWADLALGRLLARRQRELVEHHHDLLAEYERLRRRAGRSNVAGPARFTPLDVLDAPGRVTAAVRDLQAALCRDYRSLGLPRMELPRMELPRMELPTPDGQGEGRRRMICTAEQLTDSDPLADGDEEWRVLDTMPIRMLITDDIGLVMLTPNGVDAAVIVRSPAVLAGQAHYFDLLWERAAPITEPAPRDGADPLPKTQRVILSMLMAGFTDAAIAHTLGISARSVRRHVAALAERAAVTSRFGLGAAAVRLGWLNT